MTTQALDVIAYVKARIDFAQSRNYPLTQQVATLVAEPFWPKGTGIRPKLITGGDGYKVYVLTLRQAKKMVEVITGEEQPSTYDPRGRPRKGKA